ncbi:MAG: hypothetical protein IT161_13110 [Bryobacterales bacterium]|nr:hypothetical protein [Bryobacterales bacterium]
MRAKDAFLKGILDYAGLYPPAALTLDEALISYAEYKQHSRSAMLGRFVVPADLLGQAGLPDRLTVTIPGPPLPALTPAVESVESRTIFAAPDNVRIFYELDWKADFESGMDRLAGRPGAGVKLRCGGDVTPPAETVSSFLVAAGKRNLPVKFTAGLHHALPTAGQHGFLNVFCAGFAAFSGDSDVVGLLAEPEFLFFEDHLRCAGRVFSTEQIVALRKQVTSFGSCGFLEPAESLSNAGL